MLNRHRRALMRLLPPGQPVPSRIGIVGGGLFPRTALICQELFPTSNLTIIDADPAHLAIARRWLNGTVKFEQSWFDHTRPCPFDLLIIPLAYVGDSEAIYHSPPSAQTIIHDWIWRPRGRSVIVSWFLLKRLNLMTRK